MPIPTDAAVLRIVHSSEVSRGLFDGFDFHGPMCLNAYLLEGLALIEGMQDDKSASVCADLRELVAALRYARDKLAAAGFV